MNPPLPIHACPIDAVRHVVIISEKHRMNLDDDRPLYHSLCVACQWTGPIAGTKEEAIRLHNRLVSNALCHPTAILSELEAMEREWRDKLPAAGISRYAVGLSECADRLAALIQIWRTK